MYGATISVGYLYKCIRYLCIVSMLGTVFKPLAPYDPYAATSTRGKYQVRKGQGRNMVMGEFGRRKTSTSMKTDATPAKVVEGNTPPRRDLE